MKKLILIDLSGIFWRHWHATKDAELSEAFERTLADVDRARRGYDFCIVCCDAPPYKRREIFPEYKANRVAAPPLAVEQFDRTKARLDADAFLLWAVPGFEADDVIATAARLARLEEDPLEVSIFSGDKDMLQLVTEGVRVVSPWSSSIYDSDASVVEKFGVPPRQIADWLALVGDDSDNIEGVRGIGPKKATELLKEFGSLAGVLAGAARIKGDAMREAVIKGADAATLARRLVGLSDDLPLDFDQVYARREQKSRTADRGAWDEAEFSEPDHQTEPAPPDDGTRAEPPPASERKPARAIELAKPNQVLAPRPAEWSMALEPPTAQEAFIVAKYFHESRLFPQLQSQAAIFTAILRGRAIGLDAATACSVFHNVEGKLTMHAELIAGLVMRSGKADYFEFEESTHERATMVTRRAGRPTERRITWTIDDALRAGLMQRGPDGKPRGVSRSGKPSNWDKYPRVMLRWRATTELAHAVYPEVVVGLVTPDEASEGTEDAAE